MVPEGIWLIVGFNKIKWALLLSLSIDNHSKYQVFHSEYIDISKYLINL